MKLIFQYTKKYLSRSNKYYNEKIIIIAIILINIFIIEYFFKNKTCSKHKIIGISYANKKYQKQLKINKISALKVGKVDEYYSYGPNDIDSEFRKKNKEILSRERGNGYWLWKPYFILKTLKEKLKEGDYLIYTDAGVMYMNSTKIIVDFLNEEKAKMWAFRLKFKEKMYSKRDAFILLGADTPFYTETPQYMATIQIYQKSKFTEKFLEKLLYYSQDKRIITDDNNTLGKDNYIGFRDNRHDQTVFSIMIKKYRQVKSKKTNSTNDKSRKLNSLNPYIFCIYRRIYFKSYNDIKNKCKNGLFKKKKKNMFYYKY